MSKTLAFALFTAACTTSNPDFAGTAGHAVFQKPGTCDPDFESCSVPSNNIGAAFALAGTPTDLVLGTGEIDVDRSMFTPTGSTVGQTLPSVELPAADGGAPIRVFVGRSIAGAGNIAMVSSDGDLGPAVAFAATEDLAITGRLFATTGAVDIAGCTGAPGVTNAAIAGGAGGAFATAGGNGGVVTFEGSVVPQAPGGTADPDVTLVPLRGGCPGGPPSNGSGHGVAGGAIQLVSATSLDIAGAVIADANNSNVGTGGGAGGGILIEAPVVALADTAVLTARGQGGASGDTSTMWTPNFGSALSGAACQFGTCGTGGEGAVGATAAGLDGGSIDILTGLLLGQNDRTSGGGGGGIGTIRINTADGALEGSAAVVSGAFSVGTLATR